MKRLRHPIKAIREPFGKAGLIVACVALVFAMLGGAYAATSSKQQHKKGKSSKNAKLTPQQKKEVKKLAKQYAGKDGAPGAQGLPGTPGTNGVGTPGTNGNDGDSVVLVSATAPGCANGGITYEVEGSGEEDEVCNGEDGTGATGSAYTGAECEDASGEGGVKVTTAGGDNYVCNGKDGEDGETGFTDTLPPEKTEVGAFTFKPTELFAEFGGVEYGKTITTFSFPIPLPSNLEGSEVAYLAPEGGCSGTVNAPTAPPGKLCIYTSALNFFLGESRSLEGGVGTSTSGARMVLYSELNQQATGSFAVTAPEE